MESVLETIIPGKVEQTKNLLKGNLFRRKSSVLTTSITNLRPVSLLYWIPWFAFVFVFVFVGNLQSSKVVAQRIQEIITHENGLQFEGERVPIHEYSESLADSFNNQNASITMVNDGLRRVFFPIRRVANLGRSDRNEIFIDVAQKSWGGSQNGYGLLIGMTKFDENGHRILRVRTDKGVRQYVQGITRVGPRYCEVETLTIKGRKDHVRWDMRVSTDSIPVDTLIKILRKQILANNRSSEFLKIVNLLVQSRKIERAIQELRFIQERFPDEFDQLETNRKSLRQLFARNVVLGEIKQRVAVGQTRVADELASVFVTNDVANIISQEIKTIRNEIAQENQNVDSVRKNILELVGRLKSGGKLDAAQAQIVEQFSAEVESEISPANVNRFATYLRFSTSADNSDLEKLALAMSGWLVGTTVQLPNLDNFPVVQSMYPVRELVREYLTIEDQNRRREIRELLKGFEAGDPKFLVEIIKSMKPTHVPAELAISNSDANRYNGQKPIEFFVTVPGTAFDKTPKKFRCLAHVPPQYDPYRRYPCIITLRPGIPLEKQLERWAGPFDETLQMRVGRAPRNGYIVVAVDWKVPGQSNYNYSLQEHAAVLQGLKKSLQMFAIDTDRVFLSGHSSGATAAYDIAVSHPEHWAGVICFGGLLDRYCYLYGRNRHVGLPVYSVIGQKDLVAKINKDTWNLWLTTKSRQDCILVEYRGRLNEPFLEELPEIFNWCNAYRRVLPSKDGFELDFKIMRPWDNYFWFWELHDFPEEVMHRPEHWSETHPRGAPIMTAEISRNQPNVIKKLGPKKVGKYGTLWLNPDLVDFQQEVRIVASRGNDFRQLIEPSRKVILEDVVRRADRQHPFWARINCDGGTWFVPEDN